jgi:hypothetical protein
MTDIPMMELWRIRLFDPDERTAVEGPVFRDGRRTHLQEAFRDLEGMMATAADLPQPARANTIAEAQEKFFREAYMPDLQRDHPLPFRQDLN